MHRNRIKQGNKETHINQNKPTKPTNKCTDWSHRNRGVDHSHKIFFDPLEHELLINGFLKNRTKTCNQFPSYRVDEGKQKESNGTEMHLGEWFLSEFIGGEWMRLMRARWARWRRHRKMDLWRLEPRITGAVRHCALKMEIGSVRVLSVFGITNWSLGEKIWFSLNWI